jgi:hypothetical protein
MKNCGNCKFWEKLNSPYRVGFGKCHKIIIDEDMFEYSKDKDTLVLAEGYKNITAFLEDNDFDGALRSTKDFGCIMQEEGKWNE